MRLHHSFTTDQSKQPTVQKAVYTGGSQLDWRETGLLPTARRGLKAALVDNVIVLTGGRDASHNILFTSILSWDPVAESWQEASDLAVKVILL